MSHVSSVAPVATITESTVMQPMIAKPAKAAKGFKPGIVYAVSPDCLHVREGYNGSRKLNLTDKGDAWLLKDITALGAVTMPLQVVQTFDAGQPVLTVVQGHKRLECATRAGLKSVPVLVQSELDGIAADDVEKFRIYDLHRSNTGTPLSPLELGDICIRAKALGDSAEQVAAELSLTRRYVINLCIMANAPADLRAAMVAGRMAGTLVYETVQKVCAGDAAKGYALLSAVLASVGPDGKVTAKTVAAYLDAQKSGGSDGDSEGGEGDESATVAKPVYTVSKRSLFRDNVRVAIAETEADAIALMVALNA